MKENREKDRTLRENFRVLKPFIMPYKWGYIIAMAMVVITCVALVVAPTFEGKITSSLVADVEAGRPVAFGVIKRLAVVLIITYSTKTISQIVEISCLTTSIQNAMHDLREALNKKIHRLPVRYFDRHKYGDVLSVLTNDVDTVSTALQESLMQIFSGIIMIIFAVCMMISINGYMAIIAIMLIPLSLIATKIIVSRSQKRFLCCSPSFN